ncbi:NUDIX hydrolase domain-like protein [Crassisporium funariophilum]|nr:NUDIX hydrolase domain-like protein [Crassisporium funariophilum]
MPETHVNMYGGSPLNRLSWLRPSQSFLNAVVASPNVRWILFNAGQPLIIASSDRSTKPGPLYLTTADVKPFLGPEPYFGQGKEPGDLAKEKDGESHEHVQHSPTEAARHLGVPVVFLGVHEDKADDSTAALPSSEFSDPEEALKKLNGTPYFAIDVSDLEYTPEKLQEILRETTPGREGKTLDWSEPRALMSNLDHFTAGVFASARSLSDWNQRNKFCAGCGTRNYSMWGGWKLNCTSLLPWVDNSNRKPCPTSKGLHNFTHPRTDAVVIMIAIDETGDKVLLGRGKKFPGKFYSALAGFIEPGESFEDAVAREMWEEAGVHVWNIKYHSGQPWPYPANLMVGFFARADSSKPIRVDLDNELADARWFTRDEVRAVLEHKAGTRFERADYKKMTENTEGRSNTGQKLEPAESQVAQAATQTKDVDVKSDDEPPFRLPPMSAIAGVLIRDWVDGKIGYPKEDTIQKGNL